ncbi:MAG: B12-binding domain-containing protein [Desulfomonilaceae bacterium]
MRKKTQKSLTDKMTELAVRVSELKEDEVLAMIQQHLESGTPPAELLSACQEGMRLVGLLHEKGQYFIAGLIMAGEIMYQAVELLRPVMIKARTGQNAGRVVLGTIAGDIHDIGKNLFKDLLECHGFQVTDLGVDVAPAEFLRAGMEFGADLIAASDLMTGSFPQLRELVRLFDVNVFPEKVRPMIIIGGGQVDKMVFDMTGSDYWATDAFSGVRLCQKIMAERSENPTQ